MPKYKLEKVVGRPEDNRQD